MVIKVYISGISASQEIRKTQQRVLFILESLKIDHEVIDITEPGKEEQKSFMREECSKHGKNNALPPQIFVDDHYLGDYSDFEIATENDNLMTFLQLPERKFSKNGDNISAAISEENDNKGGLVNGFHDLTNGSVQIEQEQLNDEESNHETPEESDTQIDTANNDKVDQEEEKAEEEEAEAEAEAEEEEEEEEEDEDEEDD